MVLLLRACAMLWLPSNLFHRLVVDPVDEREGVVGGGVEAPLERDMSEGERSKPEPS